jgi:hypothetical protein
VRLRVTDALPLRWELAATFERAEQVVPSDDGSPVIREDRELLAELARIKRDTAFLGMCIMDGTVSVVEQRKYAERLVAASERVRRRADGMGGIGGIVAAAGTVVWGEMLTDVSRVLPGQSVEPYGDGAS